MADEKAPETTAPAADTAPAAADAAPAAADAAPAAEAAAPAAAETPDAVIGLVTDGAYTLIVAQFKTMADAEAAYEVLQEVEAQTSLRIDGVIMAECDANGKVKLGKVTDHSTKTGLKWGIVGGVVAGIIFPPSILASAASVGVVGAVLGKFRNIGHRSDLTEQLQGIMTPNTAGIVALVEDTAVVEVQKALEKADRIVTEAVDKQVALEIDRQAAAAKAQIGA
ncbi:MAG: DUF1269 domain-containing protein [Chloroflexota bacterium]